MAPPEINTERLVLSPFLGSDAAALFDYRADPEVGRYQSWIPRSLADAQSFIDGVAATTFDTPGTWFQLAIRLRDSGVLVGDLGVHFPPAQPEQVEIGFTVAPRHQGKGYGTEAVIGLLGFLFESLRKHRVYASVDPENRRSIALLKRVGMKQEAHFRKSLRFKGEWVDDVVFAVLASEWTGPA
ncbi:MAG: GNAT family protein [bacterium]